MTKTTSKYYAIKSITLAHALQFVTGESFCKFNNEDGSLVYSFVRTDKFLNALDQLLTMKQANQ